MKKQHKKFIKKLKKYLKHSPDLRITQALYNLGVTLGIQKGNDYYFIDNYNESDGVILERMKNFLKNGKKQKIEKQIEDKNQTPTGSNIEEK